MPTIGQKLGETRRGKGITVEDVAHETRMHPNMMGEMKKTINKDRRFRLERQPKSSRRRPEKPGGAPLFLNFILITLIIALGVFYFLGYRASSVEEAREEIAKGINKANPFGGAAVSDLQAKPVVDPAASEDGGCPPDGKITGACGSGQRDESDASSCSGVSHHQAGGEHPV